MSGFLLNVAASLVAAVLFVVLASWQSRVVRKILTAFASAALGVDLRLVYRNGDEAARDIKEHLARSENVRILTGRGNEFQRHLYADLLNRTHAGVVMAKVLIPQTDVEFVCRTDWVSQRENELQPIDAAFDDGALRRQIEQNVMFLDPYLGAGFQLRRYDYPHFGRLIITDESLFLTPYSAYRHGRDCAVLHFGRGDIYDLFSRLFDLLWLDSQEPIRRQHG
jgi:hypothetical protein